MRGSDRRSQPLRGWTLTKKLPFSFSPVCVECLIGKQKKPILFKVTEPSSIPYSGGGTRKGGERRGWGILKTRTEKTFITLRKNTFITPPSPDASSNSSLVSQPALTVACYHEVPAVSIVKHRRRPTRHGARQETCGRRHTASPLLSSLPLSFALPSTALSHLFSRTLFTNATTHRSPERGSPGRQAGANRQASC